MDNANSLQQEWVYREYVNRENLVVHAPLEPELDFYQAVAQGKVKEVKKYLSEDFLKKEGLGTLSHNSIHNGIYHFVITAALIARQCIQAGLSMEESYSLSDFYIQKADKCTTLREITELHDEMVLAYTRKMFVTKKPEIYSKPVADCIDYIYSNLHTRITLDTLAHHAGLNSSYLSKVFKKETGVNISEYITTQKIETAKNMLKYSKYTSAQIALILAFPSQSYFTEIFHKKTGVTPKEYKKRL